MDNEYYYLKWLRSKNPEANFKECKALSGKTICKCMENLKYPLFYIIKSVGMKVLIAQLSLFQFPAVAISGI